MREPDISWYILNQDTYENIDKECYAGAFSPSNIEVQIDMQVWNNKWGQEDATDIEEPILVLTFDTIEDNKLLEYCKVRIDNGAYLPLEILNNQGTIKLGRILSGKANIGNASATNNYAALSITFGPLTHGMKNGLKNLLIDLQFNQ